MKKILCVCLGNICRSPAAEGILKARAEQLGKSQEFFIDSAGTSGYHDGELPDMRSIRVCKAHGIDITNQRSRALRKSDGERFDLILCMDQSNVENAKQKIPEKFHEKIHLFDDHEVGDPYFSMFDGFEIMFQQLEKATEKWIIG